MRIPLWRRILCAAEGGWVCVSTRGKSRRKAAGFAGGAMGNGGETAGDAVPCTPAQGSETLEHPALAAHFMRRGGGDGLAFLPGANPAGRRRDLLVFMELSYEKARRIEGICRAKRFRHVEKGSSSEMHRPPQPGVVSEPSSPNPNPASWATLRRRTPAPRRGRPSAAHDSCPFPISRPKTANPAASRRDLPQVETKVHPSPSAAHVMRCISGIPKGLRPFGGGAGGRAPCASPRRDLLFLLKGSIF